MWTFYILECGDSSLYTGITADLNARLVRHCQADGARHTRLHPPVKLIYQEKYLTRLDAERRETQVKHWSRAKKQALIAHDFSRLKKLSH